MLNFLFWLFMLVCSLAVPGVMLGFGSRWEKHPPKEISFTYGYRTKWSMLSQETWDFAHRYCGTLWRRAGWVSLLITVAVFLPAAGAGIAETSVLGIAVVVIQCVVLCLLFIPVERALRHTFDEFGHRKAGGKQQ